MSRCMGADKRKDVSIIVLTYGDYRCLDRTLTSVALQEYPIASVLVSDDGSGVPFPADITAKYPFVQFRRNEQNMGTVAHMNATASLVDTDYIKFLAAGDSFAKKTSLTELICFAEGEKALVVTSQAMVCDEKLERKLYTFPGNRIHRLARASASEQFQILAASNLISAVGTLFHRDFFLRGFDESYRLLEDWPAWLRMTREGTVLPCLDRVTCLYGAGGVSSEDLDAYGTEKLRADMRHCYEQEILPYIKRFTKNERHYIQYGYDRLQNISPQELLKKYGFLELKTRGKRWVKQWLQREK